MAKTFATVWICDVGRFFLAALSPDVATAEDFAAL